MKNEIEELMMLTPKRKSILWRYKSDEDESIFVYGISKGRAIQENLQLTRKKC